MKNLSFHSTLTIKLTIIIYNIRTMPDYTTVSRRKPSQIHFKIFVPTPVPLRKTLIMVFKNQLNLIQKARSIQSIQQHTRVVQGCFNLQRTLYKILKFYELISLEKYSSFKLTK